MLLVSDVSVSKRGKHLAQHCRDDQGWKKSGIGSEKAGCLTSEENGLGMSQQSHGAVGWIVPDGEVFECRKRVKELLLRVEFDFVFPSLIIGPATVSTFLFGAA